MRLLDCGLVLGVILNCTPQVSSAADAPLREHLSISVTNKYGDVFTNLVVAKIANDGLVLEHKAGQLKVKYADLPENVREKYQPLAAAAENKERKDAAANAVFAAVQRREAEQVRLRSSQDRQRPRPEPATLGNLRIEIPKQGWGITVLNTGLRESGQQLNAAQFAYEAVGRNGFNLSIFVEKPANGGSGNADVFNFYWPKASRNPMIDERSIRTETKANFVKVSYTSLSIPNVNYYFAFKGKWVDVHISKAPFTKEDETLFTAFEEVLTYGE
jgi:hypothetical protein